MGLLLLKVQAAIQKVREEQATKETQNEIRDIAVVAANGQLHREGVARTRREDEQSAGIDPEALI